MNKELQELYEKAAKLQKERADVSRQIADAELDNLIAQSTASVKQVSDRAILSEEKYDDLMSAIGETLEGFFSEDKSEFVEEVEFSIGYSNEVYVTSLYINPGMLHDMIKDVLDDFIDFELQKDK